MGKKNTARLSAKVRIIKLTNRLLCVCGLRVIIKLCFGLVQVHACNILRALYRETKLGEDVFPFVSDGVVVAITGFHSNSWAVSSQFFGKLYIQPFYKLINYVNIISTRMNCLAQTLCSAHSPVRSYNRGCRLPPVVLT